MILQADKVHGYISCYNYMYTYIAYGWEWVTRDCMCGQTTITTFVTGKKFLGELLETVPQIIMHIHIREPSLL